MDVFEYLLGGGKKEKINIYFESCNFESCFISMLCILKIYSFLGRNGYYFKTGNTLLSESKKRKNFLYKKSKITL